MCVGDSGRPCLSLLFVAVTAWGCSHRSLAPSDPDGGSSSDHGPGPASVGLCRDGWCWQHPRPYATEVLALWGSSATDLFAVGQGGANILHHDGKTWSAMSAPVQTALRAVWGSGPRDVFAAGEDGTLLHYDGARWSTSHSGAAIDGKPVTFTSLWGSGPEDVFAAGHTWDLGSLRDEGLILHYDGKSWSKVHSIKSAENDAQLLGLWGSGPADLYAVGFEQPVPSTMVAGILLHYDGASWSEVSLETGEPPRAIWGDGTQLFVGGPNTLLRRDGQTWSSMHFSSITSDDVHALWGSSADDVYGLTGSAVLHHDGGRWSEVYSLPRDGGQSGKGLLTAVWGSGPADVYVTSWCDGLLRYDGNRWSKVALGVEACIGAVWGSGPDNVFVEGLSKSGFDPLVLRYDGKAWTKLAGTPDKIVTIWGAGTDLLVSTCESAVHRYDGAWTRIEVPDQGRGLYALWGPGPTDVYALTMRCKVVGGAPPDPAANQLLHYDGTSWSKLAAAPVNLTALWGTGPNDIYATAVDGSILRFDGKSWARIASPTSEFLRTIWGTGPSIFAAGAQGAILHRHEY